MKKSFKIRKVKKRIVSFILAFAMITNTVPLEGISEIISSPFSISASAETTYQPTKGADAFSGNNHTFATMADFLDYSYYYNQESTFAQNHQNDTLIITLQNDPEGERGLIPETYVGLGTLDYPFNGTVRFPYDTFTLKTHRSIFNYVYDSVKLLYDTYSSAVVLNLVRQSNVGVGECKPLLADHVVHNNSGSSADWKITLDKLSTGTYSGVLGEVGAGAIVNLYYTNNSNMSIVNNSTEVPDAGVICGVMKPGSSINLSYTGTASTYSITSTSGNAGRLVGTMEGNSALNISDCLNVIPSDISGGCYSGGLVGKLTSDATLHFSETLLPISIGGNITGTSGAGGLFGYYVNKKNEFDISSYNINATVYGQYCGGVFGVLENNKGSSEEAIELTIKNTNNRGTVSISSANDATYAYTGYFGGVAGKYTTDDLKNSLILDTLSFSATSNASFNAFGGAIGIVDSAAYIKANDVSVTASGTDKRTTLEQTTCENYAYFGGLVGATSKDSGVMIDLGNFTLNATLNGSGSNQYGFLGGGVVGQFYNGVLRLSGKTDMGEAIPDGGYQTDNATAIRQSFYGQLIGYNDNVLVYALGDGSDNDPAAFENVKNDEGAVEKARGWRYLRSNGAISDDLGTWGEVVRVFKVDEAYKNAEDAGIVTFNSTEHTVTLEAANTSMGSTVDFAKTALNIMLNQGGDYGCLSFATGNENTRDTLLGSTLTISENIDLSNTGINGFMRDGDLDITVADNGTATSNITASNLGDVDVFTGTLDGDNKKITLATGESYGIPADSTTEGTGQIYRHQFNGLFSVIGNGSEGTGTVNNLTIEGIVNVHNAGPNGMSIGGIAARSHGNTTFDGITAKQIVNYCEKRKGSSATGSWGKYLGGLIGFTDVNTDNGTIEIKGSTTLNTTFNFEKNPYNWIMCGGAIGAVESSSININVAEDSGTDSCTVSMAVAVDENNQKDGQDTASSIGGLIGYIAPASDYKNRVVNIDNTTFGISADIEKGIEAAPLTINNYSTDNAGGLLGFSWFDTTVNIKNITVSNATLNYGAKNVGVMCYDATGVWKVDSLAVNKLTINGGSESLGMLVNKAYNGTNGLYLDVLNAGYTLSNSGIELPSILKKYDELAAYSADNAAGVLTGNRGVISINMNSARAVINSDENRKTKVTDLGTYQNQLSVNSTTQTPNYANDTSRYYYNLDVMDEKVAGQNLLLWSVNKYAADNIKSEFVSTIDDSNITGIADLTGLSFYPLASADSCTLKNLAITFDYSGIYDKENENLGGTDLYTRDPGVANQHYLMHSGLFMNVPAEKTVTISGELSLAGTFLELKGTKDNVSNASNGYSGVLVSHTVNGKLISESGSTIKLDGIKPMTTKKSEYTDGYLLINNISRESDLTDAPEIYIEGVYTTNKYSTDTYIGDKTNDKVAKSLIGAATGKGLNIEFSKIKLDARDGNSTDANLKAKAKDLYNAYGTYNSIFTESTLLASINTDQNATLVYNYTYDEDWGTGTPRYVTYGKEIKTSEEYKGEENRYYGDTRFTNPIDNTELSDEYDFSTGFLPYVKTAYSAEKDGSGLNYRELKVNVMTVALDQGCGTYNDPYVITDGKQLEAVASFIRTGDTRELSELVLPKIEVSGISDNAKGNRWCGDKTGVNYHAVFIQNDGETGYYQDGNDSANKDWDATNVQYYLANAYYKINDDIELSSAFVGLGGTTANTSNTSNTAFRGVIVGEKNDDGTPMYTITNKSVSPFINVSNGSVVKDLNVVVDNTSINLIQSLYGSNNACFDYYSKCKYYGGIIGEIMGGDNIIDNSYVSYNEFSKITLSGDYGMLCPVGSYVGVVVFGGLIFKNINTVVANENANAEDGNFVVNYSGNGTNLVLETSKGAIYVNPLVGRVINGYAINESTQFSVTENNKYHNDEQTDRTGTQHSLKNTTKHYTIADINKNETALLDVSAVPSGTGTDQDGTINIPNSQAFFILSLITQSCAGTATSANGAYSNSLSYGTNNSNVYGMSHNADYTNVGTATVNTDSDYELASKDTAANTAVPYIIRRYTKKADDTIEYTYKNEEFNGEIAALNGKEFYLSNQNRYLKNDTVVEKSITKIYKTSNIADASLWKFELIEGETNKFYLSTTNPNGEKVYMCMTASVDNGNMSLISDPTSDNNAQCTVEKYDGFYCLKFSKYLNQHGGTGGKGFAGWKDGSSDNGSKITLTEKKQIENLILGGYNARYVTSTSGYYDIDLNQGETYQLPDSFRGIGSVGRMNNKENSEIKDLYYTFKVNNFNGKNCDIDIDMYINRYYKRFDNYFDYLHYGTTQSNKENKSDFDNDAKYKANGFGLFDTVIMKNEQSAIKEFVLSGSVNVESYKYDNLNPNGEEEKAVHEDTVNNIMWLSVGGVCGWSRNDHYVMFEKIELNNLSVRGPCKVAGLLGEAGISSATYYVSVKECSADNLSLELTNGGAKAAEAYRNSIAAFVGKVKEGKVIIDGGTAGKTVKFKKFSILSSGGDGYSSGGLVAYAGNGCEATNMTVCPADFNTEITIGTDNSGMSGGIVGLMQPQAIGTNNKCTANFENCVVKYINIKSNKFSGGFYGGTWDDAKGWVPLEIKIINCKMLGSSTKNQIYGATYAGGFVGNGRVYTQAEPNIEISGCVVSNYEITAGSSGYVGGFIGQADAEASGASVTCYIHDSSVEDCTLGANNNNYSGGVIGKIAQNTENKVLGYNIKLKNIDSGKADRMGAWVGYMDTSDTATSIQFSGMAIYGQGFSKNIGNWDSQATLNNASFVFADYNGMCNTDSESGTMHVSSFNYNTDTHVAMPKYPYVNINPQSNMGTSTTTDENGNEVPTTEIISGDGAVLYSEAVSGFSGKTAEKTMAAKIYADISDTSNTRRYTTFSDAEINGTNKIDYYMNRTVEDDGDRISTYGTERGSLPEGVDDFAVVVIANTNDTETTDLINRYIQLVTNTTTDYSASSDYYDIDVSTCKYSGGKFAIVTNGNDSTPGLTWTKPSGSNPGIFALNGTYADSKKEDTFTLVDVQFKDPLNTDKIAYHLYVPVYTIKQIEVDFSVAVKTGTASVSYSDGVPSSAYSDLMESNGTHIDSLETWITQYIRFTYSAEDINTLLNLGDVNWNHDKSVNFVTQSNGKTEVRVPNDTFMVLVDPNGNLDEEYYANASVFDTHINTSNKEGWKIDLAKFKKGEDSFKVRSINDIIARDLIVTSKEGKGSYIDGTDADYDVYKIASDGTIHYYKYSPNGDGAYDLSVSKSINEDYYISMYVPREITYTNELYYYSIYEPTGLSGKKSAKVNRKNSYNVLLADLYTQDTTSRMTVSPDDQQISASNKTITVQASTSIRINNLDARTYLTGTELYHSFNLFLNRYTESGVTSEIDGLDTGTIKAKYNIGSEANKGSFPVKYVDLQDNYLNIETAEIMTQLLTASYSGVALEVYSYIEMDFDENKLESEFPQKSSESIIGVNVAATSNLAYDRERLTHTSMSKAFDADSHYYYRESVNSAILYYSAVRELDEYERYGKMSQNQSRLGVNGYCSDSTEMPINTEAKYNVSAISTDDLARAETLRLTITLSKKTDTESGGVVVGAEYKQVSDLRSYLNQDITITSGTKYSSTHTITDPANSLVVEIPISNCDFESDIYNIGIGFKAITGEGFTEYANYRISLRAELLGGDGKAIENSGVSDYVVYTNAKVYPEVFNKVN